MLQYGNRRDPTATTTSVPTRLLAAGMTFPAGLCPPGPMPGASPGRRADRPPASGRRVGTLPRQGSLPGPDEGCSSAGSSRRVCESRLPLTDQDLRRRIATYFPTAANGRLPASTAATDASNNDAGACLTQRVSRIRQLAVHGHGQADPPKAVPGPGLIAGDEKSGTDFRSGREDFNHCSTSEP